MGFGVLGLTLRTSKVHPQGRPKERPLLFHTYYWAEGSTRRGCAA